VKFFGGLIFCDMFYRLLAGVIVTRQCYVVDVFCAGVNLLIGTESGLMLLDRSGQGKGVF